MKLDIMRNDKPGVILTTKAQIDMCMLILSVPMALVGSELVFKIGSDDSSGLGLVLKQFPCRRCNEDHSEPT